MKPNLDLPRPLRCLKKKTSRATTNQGKRAIALIETSADLSRAHSSASTSIQLNAHIYSNPSVQERLMLGGNETIQDRRARLEKELEELERKIEGKPHQA